MHFAELDAVTVDAFGTLLVLRDPVDALAALTSGRPMNVRRAFEAEVAYYLEHAVEGNDEGALADLRRRCVFVFNATLGSELSSEAFVGALEYEEVEGARRALASLRSRGLALAVVANWDCALPDHLERLGLARFFSTIVTSASAGAAKPDPQPFRAALDALGVEPDRALHVGDRDEDEHGAGAAGMRFAWAPLTGIA